MAAIAHLIFRKCLLLAVYGFCAGSILRALTGIPAVDRRITAV
jgi:hypothetical protein